LGFYKPALIHSKLMPSLAGPEKMSTSSKGEAAIFTTDDKKTVKRKTANAFTGGRVSVEEQRKLGGLPEVCSVHAYFNYFFEPEDAKVQEMYEECRAGKILCGECKARLFEKIWDFLEVHQKKRLDAKKVLDDFMVRD